MNIINFESIVTQYKVVFFDAFGVLKNYEGFLPGIEKTINLLDEKGIEYYVLTNDASRSPEQLISSYIDHGLKGFSAEKMISSGMLAREFIRLKINKGTIAYLGTEDSVHYLDDLGHKTISMRELDLKDINEVEALVLLDDEGFNWQRDLNKTINLLQKRNIPAVVANTDAVYPVSKDHVAVAIGGLANLIESVVGKKMIRFGKPDAQMFNFAYQYIQQQGHFEKDEILMVGDTLTTDIIGGNKFGIDTALVLSGNTSPTNFDFKIRSTGIIPDYICHSAVIR